MEKPNLSIFNFKRFCLQILAPLVLYLTCCGLVFNYFFERNIVIKSQISGAFKVNRILSETEPNEIPIFGDSRAEMDLIPDSLGADFFNYGLYATRFDVTLFFLKEECKKKKSQPLIIINLDLDGFDHGLADVSNYLYNVHNSDVRKLLGANYKAYFGIPFIKYYGRFDNIFRTYLTERSIIAKVVDKGACIENRPIPREQFRKEIDERLSAMPIFRRDSAIENELKNVINMNQDRLFIFVIAPYHRCCFGPDNSNTGMDFKNSLKLINNVRVFDFSKIPLDDSMFFNTYHLNFKGAVYYSHLLRDSISHIHFK